MLCLALLLAAGVVETPMITMPGAKDVLRTAAIEYLSFQVALTCPDSGEVVRFYREQLEPQGYTLCGPREVDWKTSPTVTGDALSYRSIFVNDATRKAILIDAGCSLTNGRTTATQQDVSLTLLHDRSTPGVEQAFTVSCGTDSK
jgi:hypothetical protein